MPLTDPGQLLRPKLSKLRFTAESRWRIAGLDSQRGNDCGCRHSVGTLGKQVPVLEESLRAERVDDVGRRGPCLPIVDLHDLR